MTKPVVILAEPADRHWRDDISAIDTAHPDWDWAEWQSHADSALETALRGKFSNVHAVIVAPHEEWGRRLGMCGYDYLRHDLHTPRMALGQEIVIDLYCDAVNAACVKMISSHPGVIVRGED